jgi:hypothetical protein
VNNQQPASFLGLASSLPFSRMTPGCFYILAYKRACVFSYRVSIAAFWVHDAGISRRAFFPSMSQQRLFPS